MHSRLFRAGTLLCGLACGLAACGGGGGTEAGLGAGAPAAAGSTGIGVAAQAPTATALPAGGDNVVLARGLAARRLDEAACQAPGQSRVAKASHATPALSRIKRDACADGEVASN